jgi:hypothetical protein
MLTLDGDYPRPPSEITLRALALYRERLQAELEPEQIGRGLAIHPDSGDYLVADTPTHAGHAMRVRHPEGGTVTLRIGLQPDDTLLPPLGLEPHSSSSISSSALGNAASTSKSVGETPSKKS